MSKLAAIRLEGLYELRCSKKQAPDGTTLGKIRMVGRGFEMFLVSDLQEKKEGLGSRGPRLQCSSD